MPRNVLPPSGPAGRGRAAGEGGARQEGGPARASVPVLAGPYARACAPVQPASAKFRVSAGHLRVIVRGRARARARSCAVGRRAAAARRRRRRIRPRRPSGAVCRRRRGVAGRLASGRELVGSSPTAGGRRRRGLAVGLRRRGLIPFSNAAGARCSAATTSSAASLADLTHDDGRRSGLVRRAAAQACRRQLADGRLALRAGRRRLAGDRSRPHCRPAPPANERPGVAVVRGRWSTGAARSSATS